METHIEKDVQSKVIDILGIYYHYANIKTRQLLRLRKALR